MLPAWYGRPLGPTCPILVNSPAIARRLRVLPVLGDLRASRRASAITNIGNGRAPFTSPGGGTLCLAGMAQLGDEGGLFELGDSTEDLADELGGRARRAAI